MATPSEVSDVSQETFVYVASAAAPATPFQWAFRSGTCSGSSVSKSASGAVIRFTGVNRTNPVEVHEGGQGTATTPFATPSVATTVHGAHVLRFVGVSQTTQVSFNGVATAYSVASGGVDQVTAAAGVFSQDDSMKCRDS